MWDEKQFFEDFVKESDKISPDEEFVAGLKKLDSEEKLAEIRRKNSSRIILKCASVAAAIVICAVAGILIYRLNRPDGNKGGEKVTLPVHAGQESTTASNEEESLSSESICKLVMDDDIEIIDGDGNAISSDTRKELEAMLEKAVVTDSITGLFGENTKYIIKGEEEITIQIYFGQYILINGRDMYCFE